MNVKYKKDYLRGKDVDACFYHLNDTANNAIIDLMNMAYLQGCLDTHNLELEKLKEQLALMESV